MIKKLRRKIILIAMLSMVLVISVIIGAINIANYNKLINDLNESLSFIHNEDDNFKGEMPPKRDDKFGPDMKFQTRYFIINIDENNDIVSSDFSHILKADESLAEDYKNRVLESNSSFIDDFYVKRNLNSIIFLECEKELDTFHSFLLTSILVSLGGCLIVFILILILSKIALKPFYLNEEKQKRFISDASHELKTPLTIINADVELIELSNGEGQWTDSIKNQTSRLANITSQLTYLSKLDELKYSLSKACISDILKESAKDISVLFEGNSVKLDVIDDIYINCNKELIKELFSILFENAYKYSSGSIYISLNKHNKNALILFSNDVELADGSYDYLFDRFYRLDSSRNSKKGGSGLGLSIAKEIVEINNGKIKAYVNNNLFTINISFKAD